MNVEDGVPMVNKIPRDTHTLNHDSQPHYADESMRSPRVTLLESIISKERSIMNTLPLSSITRLDQAGRFRPYL